MKEYNIIELESGLRIVHKQVQHTKVAHCGFVLDIGSRDENFKQQGIAHFLEHMAFKGTRTRKAYHIINRLESVGGELNAFTTKEKIYFYASVLDKHFERAFELLTDITFNSIFPEKEIQKEKGVILEEMAMYQDAPEDAIFDEFDTVVFPNHSLGYNILGTSESVNSFTQQDFLNFLDQNLNSQRLIVSVVGNITLKKLQRVVDKHLRQVPKFDASSNRMKAKQFKPEVIEIKKPINQAHCMIGTTAYALSDERRIPFFVLNQLLGGSGMTSRLNMMLREKNGLVYNVESNYTTYVDTGLFTVYFGTEKKQLNRALKLVKQELKKLKEVPLGKVQLATIKEQLCGQLAMAEESNVSMMQMMAKSMLDLGEIDTLNVIFDKINDVSSANLQDLANEVFQEDRLSYLSYIPE